MKMKTIQPSQFLLKKYFHFFLKKATVLGINAPHPPKKKINYLF